MLLKRSGTFICISPWRRLGCVSTFRSSRTYMKGRYSRRSLAATVDILWLLRLLLYGTVVGVGATYHLHHTWPFSFSKHPEDISVIKVASLQDHRIAHQTSIFTPEQVDRQLRARETTYKMSALGVSRYDRTTLPSNSVMEDAHSEAIVEVYDGRKLGFWGIYDGHIGTAMSTALSKSLINTVALEVEKCYATNISPGSESIAQAIKRGFLAVDRFFVWERHENLLQNMPPPSSIVGAPLSLPATQLLQEAFTGSCALLSMYDSRSHRLQVALVGDSRALLGRRNEQENAWNAIVLSLDQLGSNRDEEARIRTQHPGEEDVLKNQRLLGSLEPTRAFGDLYYKWTDTMQSKIRTCYLNDGNLGNQLAANISPPYLAADPVVTSIQIQPEKEDFLVMASDGLWELLSNEEVVALVGRWIDERQQFGAGKVRGGWGTYISQVKLTVLDGDSMGQKRPGHSGTTRISPDDRFVMEDHNAATHLLRNALGGQLHDGQMVRAMLSLSSPLSRRYRDDLTIMVIFFGDIPTGSRVEGCSAYSS